MKGRKGTVRLNNRDCGILEETKDGYRFRYLQDFLEWPEAKAVSLSLPCRAQPYESEKLFPFFSGLLAEGTLRDIQCRMFKIDPDDDFGLLLETAGGDVIGAVSVGRMEE
jgi:serine/threonine-protein kinase HipA